MRRTTGPVIKLRKGEKLIITILAVLAVLTPLLIVYTSAYASSLNIEVEKLKEKIENQENVNTSLSMEVDELASLSNIKNVAKTYGLSYDNSNIIVIK